MPAMTTTTTELSPKKVEEEFERRGKKTGLFGSKYEGLWKEYEKRHGNYEGEAANQPGLVSVIGDYPEAFSADRNFPIGRLATFQRHRARLCIIYDFDPRDLVQFSVSGLWRIESGPAYSLVATGVPLSPIQEALLGDYPDAPSDQDLYFGERGSETFPGYGVVDFSVNYPVPVFKTLRPKITTRRRSCRKT